MSNYPFIHLVADYGIGDPAFGEVTQRLKSMVPAADIYTTSVPKFDTLGTGFWIYQYAMGDHPENTVIYSNTAPRKDRKEAREKNHGEHLMYAQLKNGMEILAVNSGYCFSFIKPHIKSLKEVNVPQAGSQFRSRDFYPQAVAGIIKQDDELLGKEHSSEHIPDIPEERLMWIDGYGNLKTTIRKEDFDASPGDLFNVSINKIKRTALVAGGNFSVHEGELSFSPGSSGYENPFMELFLRGGSAHQLFEYPRAGAKILIEKISQ